MYVYQFMAEFNVTPGFLSLLAVPQDRDEADDGLGKAETSTMV